MKRYEGFLICTDMDGTFAQTPENLAAIRHFQANGGRFTIASGRSCSYIRGFAEQFAPNAPIIAMNGSLLCDEHTGEPLHSFPLAADTEAAEAALQALDAAAATALTQRIILYGRDEQSLDWPAQAHCPPSRLLRELPLPWYKAILIQDAAATLALRDILRAQHAGIYRIDRSWPEGVEIQSAQGGKGAGIRWIRAHLGEAIHTVIGVGDYENDLSLLEAADLGYAVANAMDELKRAANRLTVRHDEHAIARIIAELPQNRG